MYKMVTCDLDETLLRRDGSISSQNIESIKRLAKVGIKFVPNSGRSFESMRGVLRQLNLENQANQYVISYNGGVIIENRQQQVMVTHEMPFQEADRVFKVLSQFATVAVHVYTLNHLYIYHPRTDDVAYLKTRGVEFSTLKSDDFNVFKNQKIIKIIGMNPRQDILELMHDRVLDEFQDQIQCTYSSGQYMEVNHYGVSKGQAVNELGQCLSILSSEIIAIGDNSNDLSMLEQVGMPVAVNNAIPAVKEVAKLVTIHDFECGVAEAIDQLIPFK